MDFMYKNKRLNLNDICSNVTEFIDFLDEKIGIKQRINFKNRKMLEKIDGFFEYYRRKDGLSQDDRLREEIFNFFGFKKKSLTSIKSYMERGFSKEEAENKRYQLHKERVDAVIKRREELFEKTKQYTYGSKCFTSEEEPVCKYCGSKLKLELQQNGTKRIRGCLNNECLSYYENNPSNAKLKGLVPDDIYENHLKKWKENNKFNKIYWIKRGLTEEEAIQKISEMQKYYASLIDWSKQPKRDKRYIIDKFGEEYAKQMFAARSIWNKEYWLTRGYTEEEAIEKISEYQRNNASKVVVPRENNRKCIEYWTSRGYSVEEGKHIISESQKTFSKDICIEKYGEVEGLKRWEERQKLWQKTLYDSGNLKVGYSAISQELFDSITEKLENKKHIFYGTHMHEYFIRDEEGNHIFDFTDLDNRKMIEFQGDIYHGNPKIYKEDDRPNPYRRDMTCKDLWEYDEKKKQIAEKHNFKVMYVWENDYRENKENVINECINFLKNE